MVQTRKDSGLAHELIAGFAQNFFGKVAVVFDLFKRTLAPFEAHIIGQVDVTHPSLTYALLDAIAFA
jgi:hypothetical protein